jgi:hypothetical protein
MPKNRFLQPKTDVRASLAGPEFCGVISGAKAQLGKVDVRSTSATWDKES